MKTLAENAGAIEAGIFERPPEPPIVRIAIAEEWDPRVCGFINRKCLAGRMKKKDGTAINSRERTMEWNHRYSHPRD